MDLTQIRYFLALSRTLNFTRAAEACHVTQPALTRSIQRLEDEMGGPLILRERGQTQLTELGRRVLPTLQQAADAAEGARRLASEYRRQDRMPLRLAVGPGVETASLSPLLRELGRRMPQLEVSVRLGGTADMNAWLLSSEVDAGLTADAEGLTDRANRWPLFEDAVVVLVAPGHALAGDGPIGNDDAAPHLVVAHGDTDCPLERIRARLAGPVTCHASANEAQASDIVAAGLGLGLSTARQPGRPGILRRPISPPEALSVCLAAIPGRPASQAAQAFLKLARARAWAVA